MSVTAFRIMVVDDEADVRAVLRLALAPKFEVVEAHDGLDALEKLERSEPDFMVLDVMMPLMDGFQVCRVVRKNPRFR
ncbi:response regulator, partial [Candidatus Sumerlaeota bacterium]|nr:response regulator [Candidatus Sumerlaeota bacterium]